MSDIGRAALLKKAGTVIAGVQTKSISWAGSEVAITNDDSAGKRKLLTVPGIETLDISVSGVLEGIVLRGLALGASGKLLTDLSFVFSNGDIITGNFFMPSYAESGTHNAAVTFTAAFHSSGAWTYTPF